MTPASTRRGAWLLGAAVVLVGCTGEPMPAPSPTPSVAASPTEVNDPDQEALEARVGELGETLAALRSSLEAAATGETGALEDAAALLVADVAAVTDDAPAASTPGDVPDDDATVDATDGGDAVDPDEELGADVPPPTSGPAPLLPGPVTSRAESVAYGDLLTRLLAAGRGAGSAGEPTLRFLADPVAGDLGAWQRAPGDQLAAIARAGQAGDLATTEAAVLDLTGEAPRALAWVVHGLAVPADAEEAAGRALAHLTVIDVALDQLA